MEVKLNFVAILLALSANFILGWLWYGPLFGKAWAKEMKMDMSATPDKSVMLKGMLMMVIGNFLMAYVMANDIFVWKSFPGMENMGLLATACSSSFFTWLGYYVPTHIGATTWENKSWKLTGINLAYHWCTLFIASLIILLLPS